MARVIPVHKSGDKHSVTNYRPISLLCTTSKVIEHFIFGHVSSFLESKNFFASSQHGFRRGLSTVTQLLHITNEFIATLDKEGQIDVIFLDFQKAFDRVSHSNLMTKLRSLLNNNQLVKWLDSYLSNRHQYVQIAKSKSKTAPVLSGVPQGSVLGPLLFLIYLNDLAFDSSVRSRFFADDCIVCNIIETIED